MDGGQRLGQHLTQFVPCTESNVVKDDGVSTTTSNPVTFDKSVTSFGTPNFDWDRNRDF